MPNFLIGLRKTLAYKNILLQQVKIPSFKSFKI